MSKSYAYIRVSTKDQNINRQLDAISGLNIPEKNIFIDKMSGKNFNRPQYAKLIKKLNCDDILYIKSIDRLGRNYDEILEQWRIITKDKKAHIVVIDMPLLNTVSPGSELTERFVADLVLQILSYVAQTEREFIKQRQKEGIAAAKARGIKFGAPVKPLPKNFQYAKNLWLTGQLSVRQAAKLAEMPPSTFYTHCKNAI